MAPSLFALTALSFISCFSLTQAVPYTLAESFSGATFFNNFNFITSDPSGGWVSYQDQASAQALGYASAGANSAYIGVDYTSVLNPGGAGRRAVRIESKNSYNRGLFIGDFNHMPVGCGTWPAFWMYGPNWPYSGEIDILEGVNNQAVNQVSAHTSNGCMISGANSNGRLIQNQCYQPSDNSGCYFRAAGAYSYGSNFNAVGGGVYAMQWTESWISVWFFRRGYIPADISSQRPDPATWGRPMAQFAGPDANINQRFANMKIVVNTDFCGPWASAVWGGCPGTSCVNYVASNPSAFANAYWSINSIRYYKSPTMLSQGLWAMPADGANGTAPANGTTPTSTFNPSTLSSVTPLASLTSIVPPDAAMGATVSPVIGPTLTPGVSVTVTTSLVSNPPTSTGTASATATASTSAFQA